MFAPIRPRPTIPSSMAAILVAARAGLMLDRGMTAARMPVRCRAMTSIRMQGRRATTDTAADVLVIFGITGDLAKKMTFRALYRLERRGKLDCPIIGVALDEWDDERAAPARPRGDRGHGRRPSTRRSSSGSPRGSPTSRATTPTRPPTSGVERGARATPSTRSSTSRSRPRCSPPSSRASARPGSTDERPGRDREAVRPRPRVGAGAQRRALPRCSTRTRSSGSTITSARSR